MKKILIIASHPDIEHSYANKLILATLECANLNLEVHYIDKLYPAYDVNVSLEQGLLLDADIIVLQFPFYWYSVPAALKNWIDKVLLYGFAYGSSGDKLKGKQVIVSTTIGGPEDSYSESGYNSFTVQELLRPLEQTAKLTQMAWNDPIYTHGCIYIPNVYNTQEEVELRAINHSQKLIDKLKQLSL